MVTTFLRNPQNVILCVEPSGDAANLKTLGRCKQVDPNFERTVLIRTKLDKYYNDLSPLNVNEWFEGFGDLPKGMPKFAVSLPFWQDEAKSAQAAARSSQTASPNKNESTSSPSEDWGDGDSAVAGLPLPRSPSRSARSVGQPHNCVACGGWPLPPRPGGTRQQVQHDAA